VPATGFDGPPDPTPPDHPPAQVRVPMAEVADLIRALVDGRMTWEAAGAKYPAVVRKEE